MIAYFDTAAVVRLLVEDEAGSEVCLRVFLQAESVTTVRLTFAEVCAALARAARLGRLTTEAHDSALAEFESVWDQMDVMEVDDDPVRQAGRLARTHGLRGYDAVHCAAGLRARGATTVGLAGDRELLTAWRAGGLQVIDTQP